MKITTKYNIGDVVYALQKKDYFYIIVNGEITRIIIDVYGQARAIKYIINDYDGFYEENYKDNICIFSDKKSALEQLKKWNDREKKEHAEEIAQKT